MTWLDDSFTFYVMDIIHLDVFSFHFYRRMLSHGVHFVFHFYFDVGFISLDFRTSEGDVADSDPRGSWVQHPVPQWIRHLV